MSNTVHSEIEMIERPGCIAARTCTLSIRIKNGATLAACASDDLEVAVERAGVAWHVAADGGIVQ